MPKSLLWRTFLLLATLMLASVAAWLFIFREAELERRARQLAELIASVTNITRVALLAARPEHRRDLLAELSELEGVRIYPADEGDRFALPARPFTRRLEAHLKQRLGAPVRLAFELNGEPGLFVRFRLFEDEPEEYWLALPRERLARHFPWLWLGWGAAVLLLSLAGAWLIVFRVTQPLEALERAARDVGAGQTPPMLPERGPAELIAVIRAFNQMSENLKRLEADRALLLAGISHDLRTPLTRLALEVEMSVADPVAREAMAADIAEMDRSLGQFLDFARPFESAPLRELDLAELLADLAQSYRGRLASAEFAPTPVRAQPEALRRALVNLIENALRHGGAPVELALSQENGSIVISVFDRGPGIAPEEIERLKQPFTRGEAARSNTGGAGLGLAIVERIARAHGGRLELQPRAGGGLAARFVLPA
ncbi:MAG: ATP-binding protein [Rhodocyclaceae bacterium]|nr:ATP-binding protein [Rhodocyclaceae bacterium]